MRQRTTAINIRVTEGEKRKMETAAKKCGLSLSAYLRKLGLGKEVQATLPQEFYEAYRGLTSLRDNWKSLSDDRISDGFDYVVSKLLKAYHSIGEPEWIYNKKVDKYDKIEDRKRRNKKCLQKIRNTPRNISKQ